MNKQDLLVNAKNTIKANEILNRFLNLNQSKNRLGQYKDYLQTAKQAPELSDDDITFFKN